MAQSAEIFRQLVEVHKKIILTNFIPSNDTLQVFQDLTLLLPTVAKEIEEKDSRESRILALLDFLVRRGTVIESFCNALAISGHTFLADFLSAEASEAVEKKEYKPVLDRAELEGQLKKLETLIPVKIARDEIFQYIVNKVQNFIARERWASIHAATRGEGLVRTIDAPELAQLKKQLQMKEEAIQELKDRLEDLNDSEDVKRRALEETGEFVVELKQKHTEQLNTQIQYNLANESHLQRMTRRQKHQEGVAQHIVVMIENYLKKAEAMDSHGSAESLETMKERDLLTNMFDKAKFAVKRLFKRVQRLENLRSDYDTMVEESQYVLRQIGHGEKAKEQTGLMALIGESPKMYILMVQEELARLQRTNASLRIQVETLIKNQEELEFELSHLRPLSSVVEDSRIAAMMKDREIKELKKRLEELRKELEEMNKQHIETLSQSALAIRRLSLMPHAPAHVPDVHREEHRHGLLKPITKEKMVQTDFQPRDAPSHQMPERRSTDFDVSETKERLSARQKKPRRQKEAVGVKEEGGPRVVSEIRMDAIDAGMRLLVPEKRISDSGGTMWQEPPPRVSSEKLLSPHVVQSSPVTYEEPNLRVFVEDVDEAEMPEPKHAVKQDIDGTEFHVKEKRSTGRRKTLKLPGKKVAGGLLAGKKPPQEILDKVLKDYDESNQLTGDYEFLTTIQERVAHRAPNISTDTQEKVVKHRHPKHKKKQAAGARHKVHIEKLHATYKFEPQTTTGGIMEGPITLEEKLIGTRKAQTAKGTSTPIDPYQLDKKHGGRESKPLSEFEPKAATGQKGTKDRKSSLASMTGEYQRHGDLGALAPLPGVMTKQKYREEITQEDAEMLKKMMGKRGHEKEKTRKFTKLGRKSTMKHKPESDRLQTRIQAKLTDDKAFTERIRTGFDRIAEAQKLADETEDIMEMMQGKSATYQSKKGSKGDDDVDELGSLRESSSLYLFVTDGEGQILMKENLSDYGVTAADQLLQPGDEGRLVGEDKITTADGIMSEGKRKQVKYTSEDSQKVITGDQSSETGDDVYEKVRRELGSAEDQKEMDLFRDIFAERSTIRELEGLLKQLGYAGKQAAEESSESRPAGAEEARSEMSILEEYLTQISGHLQGELDKFFKEVSQEISDLEIMVPLPKLQKLKVFITCDDETTLVQHLQINSVGLRKVLQTACARKNLSIENMTTLTEFLAVITDHVYEFLDNEGLIVNGVAVPDCYGDDGNLRDDLVEKIIAGTPSASIDYESFEQLREITLPGKEIRSCLLSATAMTPLPRSQKLDIRIVWEDGTSRVEQMQINPNALRKTLQSLEIVEKLSSHTFDILKKILTAIIAHVNLILSDEGFLVDGKLATRTCFTKEGNLTDELQKKIAETIPLLEINPSEYRIVGGHPRASSARKSVFKARNIPKDLTLTAQLEASEEHVEEAPGQEDELMRGGELICDRERGGSTYELDECLASHPTARARLSTGKYRQLKRSPLKWAKVSPYDVELMRSKILVALGINLSHGKKP